VIDGKSLTALLPMKAHSARVTSKNFRMIAGKPLFRWILDSLLETPEIDRVVINTDARDILSANGLNDGDGGGKVMIRDRKPEICGDFVSMNLVLGDDIANVKSDHYLMTHTTNPLLQVATIRAMIRRYMEENSVCYLFSPESFASTGARIGKKPLLFATPRLQSVDIDEPADWFMAESLLMRVVAGEVLPEA